MKKSVRISAVVICCAFALLLQGCTREKAEAIKVAAQTLRAEAVAALDQLRSILRGNTAMPPQDNDKLAEDLRQEEAFSIEMLENLLTEGEIGAEEAAATDAVLQRIEIHYVAFAEMFDELERGHFFASDAVRAAERHAVNLTVQMITLARMIEEKKIPVKLNAKRILLVEQIQRHNTIPDENLKRQHLKAATQQLLALAAEERQLREEAIMKCLKAAEAGRLLTRLIREYRTLSAEEILRLTQQSLGVAAQLSGQNPDVVGALERFKAVETRIKEDPYWSQLLEKRFQFD